MRTAKTKPWSAFTSAHCDAVRSEYSLWMHRLIWVFTRRMCRFVLILSCSSSSEPPHDKMTVCPAKTQVSLGIRPVWSESSLSAWRKLGSLDIHWAHSEDSDQTGRMPRLSWVFAGRTLILLVLSCSSSFLFYIWIWMKWAIHHAKTCRRGFSTR